MSDKTVKPDIIGLTASLIVWGIKKLKNDSGIMDVVKATHLQNKEKEAPILIKEHPTETGIDYVFALPAGVDKVDFEKHRHYFETYTNSIVEIRSEGRKLTLSTHKNSHKDVIKFEFDPSLYPNMLAPFPVGYSLDRKLKVFDMADVYHMLIGGVTGYGKTSSLLGMAVSFLLRGCEVSVIDKKAVDFTILEDYIDVATSEEEVLIMLERTVKEMERRVEVLRKAKVQKIQQLNGMTYKVLIIDEAADIEDNISWSLIDKLVRKARAAGIGLILATQKPSANTSKGFTDIRSNLAGRLCYYCNGDANDSQVILGKGNSRGADLTAVAGSCVWKWKTEELLQSMFLDANRAIEILRANDIPKVVRGIETTEQCEESCPT